MTAPDDFRQRARRAYELGRLRHASVKAWPALLLTAISCWLCHEPGLSVAIGGGVFGPGARLLLYGRIRGPAARAGLEGGIAAVRGAAGRAPSLLCSPFSSAHTTV